MKKYVHFKGKKIFYNDEGTVWDEITQIVGEEEAFKKIQNNQC